MFTNVNRQPGGSQSPNPKSPLNLPQGAGSEHNRYDQNMPTFMRMMDNPNYRNIVHMNPGTTEKLDKCQVISKNQGWITIDPANPDRKHPLEKAKLGDASKVNVLSPQWMQVHH